MSTNPIDLVKELERQVLDRFRDHLAFSWLNKGVLSEVRQQGRCHCCWIFPPTGSMESQYLIRMRQHKLLQTNGEKACQLPRIQLAAQELLDCYKDKFPEAQIKEEDELGCYENSFKKAFNYAKEFGILEETNYPFKGRRGNCRCDKIKGRKFYVANHERIDKNDPDAVFYNICEHPIPCSIAGSEEKLKELRGLKDEIYIGNTEEELALLRSLEQKMKKKMIHYHAVLIVGYGEEGGVPFFLVKNSWGIEWGFNGYGRIAQSAIVGHLRRPTSTFAK